MKTIILALLGVFVVTFAAGCSPYLDDYQYAPRPAVADIPAPPPQQYPPLTVLASVIGIRRADSNEDIPLSVEVRLRLQNNGPATVVFDPRTLMLTNGALNTFPPPMVEPPRVITLPPGQEAVVSAWFPFPGAHGYSDPATDSLQLRWTLTLDGKPITQVCYFHRIYPYYYYYYSPPPPVWIGGTFFFGGGGHGGHGR